MKNASLFQAAHLARGFLGLVLVVGAAPAAFAQELLPELATPAAQHKAAGEELDKQKLEAIALAAKSYVSALDSVEKSATAKGELDLVAAVVKEREAAASGALEPDMPDALKKAKLQMSRKTLLASITRINADFAKRKEKADADYLRVLASLQPKAAANPELAKQLAAEKAAVLDNGRAGAGAGGAAKASKISRGKNVIANGDFEKIVDGKPERWEYAEQVSVETENGNTFIRLERNAVSEAGTVNNRHLIHQDINFSKGTNSVTVAAKLRTKNCAIRSKKDPKIPCVVVHFMNQEGKTVRIAAANWGVQNGSWKSITTEDTIPTDAVEASVTVTSGFCPGQIDFDDIEVTFK